MILPDDNEFSYLLATGNTRSTTRSAINDESLAIGEGALNEAWEFLAMVTEDNDDHYALDWSFRFLP